MRDIFLIALSFGVAIYGQSAWQDEMNAGNAALGPKTADEAEQHFRAAVAAASSPAEKAAALTKLGLVLESLVAKSPSPEFLTSNVEPLYAEAVRVDCADTADHALSLELYSMLLERTSRPDEAAALRASAVKIRKSMIASSATHDLTSCPGGAKRIGDGVSAPKLVSKVEPVYSEEARAMHYQGTVVLYVVVGSNGQIIDGSLVRGLGLGLDEHAMDAVRTWAFDPGTKTAHRCVSRPGRGKLPLALTRSAATPRRPHQGTLLCLQ